MFGTQQLIPLFCLRVDLPPLFYTCSTGEGTAGDKIRLRCIVRTSEGLVARPFLNWTGVGVGDSAVTESEIIVVSEIESERHLTFNPLRTSHGGQYRGTGNIIIPSIDLHANSYISRYVYVQSKQ